MCLHGPMVHGFHSCSILFIVPAVGPWDVRAGRAPPTSRLRRPGHSPPLAGHTPGHTPTTPPGGTPLRTHMELLLGCSGAGGA